MSDRTMTSDLLALLRRHYIDPGRDLPGGVFVSEVGWNGRGGNSSRCDAIYVGFTSTSGRTLIGHEIKASRSDWLAELAKDGKADAWHDECHAWYVVAPSIQVVHVDELPRGWGLLVPGQSRTKMTVAARATVKTDHQPSWDAVRSVIARYDTLRAQEILDARVKADDRMRAEVDRRVEQQIVARTDAGITERLRQDLADLREALGVDRISHQPGPTYGDETISLDEIREAARFLRAHRDIAHAAASLAGRYADPTERLHERVDDLAEALAALRALAAGADPAVVERAG